MHSRNDMAVQRLHALAMSMANAAARMPERDIFADKLKAAVKAKLHPVRPVFTGTPREMFLERIREACSS